MKGWWRAFAVLPMLVCTVGANAESMQAPADAPNVPALPPYAEISLERDMPVCDAYYPTGATATGTTVLVFAVMSKGDIGYPILLRSSGSAELDGAALKCLAGSHLSWDMGNQEAIPGGFVANGQARIKWVRDAHSTLSFECPYPIVPMRRREEGTIDLSYRVLRDGTVSDPKVTRSSGFVDLDNAALSCVAKYRYVPVSIAGAPIDANSHGFVTFHLAQ